MKQILNSKTVRMVGVCNANAYARGDNMVPPPPLVKAGVYLTYQKRELGLGLGSWRAHGYGLSYGDRLTWLDLFELVHRGPTFAILKNEALTRLKARAGARFKILAWAKTPFGDWMDAGFVESRNAQLGELAMQRIRP